MKKNTILRIFIGILLILCNVNSWNFVSVDYGITYGRDSLALDSDGNPCFIFKDNQKRFIYECWNGNSFYDVNILEDNILGHKGFALALDNNNIPHICLVNASNDLTYYVLSGNEFIKDRNLSSSEGTCGIDTDKNNNPHIIYGNDDDIKESFLSSGSWITSIIYESIDGLVDSPFIRISQDDMKYVLFKQKADGSYGIHLANSTFDSVDWENTQLEYSVTPNVLSGDLAMYNNYAYMSYRHSSTYPIVIQSTFHGNDKLNLYNDTSTIYSLAIQENVYAIYIIGGNIHLITNETGSYQDTVEFGNIKGIPSVPTLTIDEDKNKWILYTSDSNITRLAYESPLYTISGTIYDSQSINEVENAYICFNDGVNDYCDYSDSNGDYDIDLFAGDYSLLITKSGYNDYPIASVTISSDLPNTNYYINLEGITIENQSSVVLTFLHYLDNTPIIAETMELKYIAGCQCLIDDKLIYYFSTDSEGKITQTIYKGDYELSPKGEYLIYSEWGEVYTTVTFSYIDGDNYAKVFKLKPYSAVDNLVYGKTKSAVTGLILTNISVIMYNSENYYFSEFSNETGDYQLLDVIAGTYNIYAYDGKSPIEYEKTSEDLIIVENETEQDLYLYSKVLNDTITLRWNITDCSDDSSLANLTTIMEDSGGLPIYYNLSGEDGIAKISEIERGWYNIFHRLTGYITQSSEYNHQISYNLSVCLRELGIELCYKINGTIYASDSVTPLQLAEFRIKNEYGTLLTYITDSTGIYNTDKDEGGRCLEEGYYTLEVTREGYNVYSELLFLDSNLSSHNITMNESEDKVTYTVIVADKKDDVPIENAFVNLTEEWISNLSINKICFHPDSYNGCIFSNLRKGHYVVEINAEGYNSEKFRKYITGDVKSIVLLDESEPHYTLKVQVLGKEANDNFTIALKDSEVTLYRVNLDLTLEKIRSEISGIGGFIWFDNLIKGEYRIKAEKDSYYPEEKDVFLDSNKEIEIILIGGDISETLEDQQKSTVNMVLYILYNFAILPMLVIVVFLITSLVFMIRDIFNPSPKQEKY